MLGTTLAPDLPNREIEAKHHLFNEEEIVIPKITIKYNHHCLASDMTYEVCIARDIFMQFPTNDMPIF